jgi:hypothetical protein
MHQKENFARPCMYEEGPASRLTSAIAFLEHKLLAPAALASFERLELLVAEIDQSE